MKKFTELKDSLEVRYFSALMEFLTEQTRFAKIPEEQKTEYMLVLLMRLIAKEKTGKGSLDGYVIFKANEA